MNRLTEEALREAFERTNAAEPLAEDWPKLERFAREIERLVNESHARKPYFLDEALNSGDGAYRP